MKDEKQLIDISDPMIHIRLECAHSIALCAKELGIMDMATLTYKAKILANFVVTGEYHSELK